MIKNSLLALAAATHGRQRRRSRSAKDHGTASRGQKAQTACPERRAITIRPITARRYRTALLRGRAIGLALRYGSRYNGGSPYYGSSYYGGSPYYGSYNGGSPYYCGYSSYGSAYYGGYSNAYYGDRL